jgi:ubiquinone/menaquinone biosynthesis C-methylase UbiE
MVSTLFKFISQNFALPKGIAGKLSTLVMNIINQKQYTGVLKNIALTTNDKILDVGFGNGYMFNKLFSKNVPIELYGIEISEDMIKFVTKKYERYINKNILKLYESSINETIFDDGYFDKVYTINTMYFWNEPDSCIGEINRILKPNGIFINMIYTKAFLDITPVTNYGFKKYEIDEIRELIEHNGMKIFKIEMIQKNKSYCIISEKM